jgi:hypothetical protein
MQAFFSPQETADKQTSHKRSCHVSFVLFKPNVILYPASAFCELTGAEAEERQQADEGSDGDLVMVNS